MATFKKTSGGQTMPLGVYGPRSPGRFITYWSRGQLVAASWPRPRKTISDAQREQWEEFKELANALKNIPADMRVASEEIAEGSKYVWRDIASLFMTGRMVSYPNYGIIVANYNLDILTQIVGSLVMRDENEWVGLDPGAEGQILAIEGGLPAWIDNSGNPGHGPAYQPAYRSGRRYLPPSSAPVVNATAVVGQIKAWPFYIPHITTVDGFKCFVSNISAGGLIQVGVYLDDDGVPGALIRDAGAMTAAATGERTITGLALQLQPGFVWIASQVNQAINMIHMPATANIGAWTLGINNLSVGNSTVNHVTYTNTFGTGAMPDPLPGTPTWTSSTFPAIALVPA